MLKKGLLISMLVASPMAFADSLYTVDHMFCRGQITGDHSSVHSSYDQLGMRLTSFRSRRRDGSLAPSLEVRNAYFGPNERVIDSDEGGSEVWYLRPLRRNGSQVYLHDMSGRGDDLNLRIVRTVTDDDGNRIQFLTGSIDRPNTVAGSYGYSLRCRAQVVSLQDTRIIDRTRSEE